MESPPLRIVGPAFSTLVCPVLVRSVDWPSVGPVMLVEVSDRSYYEAIAQIIPILFLTMAIGEARVRIRDTVSLRSAVLGVLFIGALLVAAEVAALRVLKTGHGSHVAKDATALGLGVGFAWVVRTLAIGVCRDRTEDEDELPTGVAVLVDAAFAVTASVVTIALIL